MKIKIFVIAVVWLLLSFLPAQAQTKLCGCADKEYLLDRLNQSEMAAQELEFQINLIRAREKADGKTIMATDKEVNAVRNELGIAEISVRNLDYDGGEKMNDVNCSITRTTIPPSDCVELIDKHYYDVLQKACLASKGTRGSDQPYYQAMEMKSYLFHLMVAHQEVKKFILQMLKSLPKNCRPNGWFGYVFYQKVKAFVSNRNIPPRNTQYKGPSSGINIVNGGSETTDTKEIYIGALLVREGKAVSTKVNAAVSFNSNKTVNGRTYCYPRKPDESFTSTSGVKSLAAGVRDYGSSFSLVILPDQRKYIISGSFPSVTATGKSSRFSEVSGGCGAILPINENGTVNIPMEGGNYGIDETINSGSSDYLEGSKSEKPPFLNQGVQGGKTSGTNTYEIQVRWMLRRLPAR